MTSLMDDAQKIAFYTVAFGAFAILMVAFYVWLSMMVVHLNVARRMVTDILEDETEATAMRIHELITQGPLRVNVSLSTIYILLRRMERQGVLVHHAVYDSAEVTAMRGGHPRIYYRLSKRTR